jgi:hypothetical protein
MDPLERSHQRREARRRLWARRRRIGLLRSRVVAVSLIGFVLLWGVVFTQMATGNDPVLGSKHRATHRPNRATHRPSEAADPPPEAEAVEAEPQVETELETEPEPESFEPEVEPESFEPEPVETAQS